MSSVIAFFRLIRLQNLLIIVLTQYLMQYGVVAGILKYMDLGMTLQLGASEFLLMVLSTVFIAAGGYAINDYYDQQIDAVNKPNSRIVGVDLSSKAVMRIYLVLTFIGLGMAAYLGWELDSRAYVAIHLLAVVVLWYYSTILKNLFLVGNLAIAFLAGLVPLIVGLYEVPLINAAYPEIIGRYQDVTGDDTFNPFNSIAFYVIGYASFAFLLTLAREITKDIMDVEGDKAFGCKTVPIVLGEGLTRWIVVLLYGGIAAALVWVQFELISDLTLMQVFTYALALCMLVNAGMMIRARTSKQFKRSSTFNKLTSVLGILSSVWWYLVITQHPWLTF